MLSYTPGLQDLGLLIWIKLIVQKYGLWIDQERRIRGDLMETFKILNGLVDMNMDKIFSILAD